MTQPNFARLIYRFGILFIVAGVLAAMSLAGGRPSIERSVAAAQPKPTGSDEGPVPCDPKVKRTVDKQIVQEGDTIRVTVEYSYACSSDTKKINFMLVVENTENLRGPRDQRLKNVKEGLKSFVNQVDFSNGSKVGLELYADDFSVRMPLRGESGQGNVKEDMLSQISRIQTKPIGNSAGAGPAIRDATGQLPIGVISPNFINVMLIVDAGASETSKPLINRADACNAAKDSGVIIGVVALKDAGYRMYNCASPGWFKFSQSDEAAEVTGFFSEFSDKLLRGMQATKDEYEDNQDATFEYVVGSGNPRDPDLTLGSDYVWKFTTQPGRPVSRRVMYDVKAAELGESQVVPLSIESFLNLSFTTSNRSVQMPNPDICIYTAEKPEFCDAFRSQLTATAQAVVATPTTGPTSAPPTAGPTDVPPTPTDVPPTPTEGPTVIVPTLPPPPTHAPPTATLPTIPTRLPTPTIANGIYLPLCLYNYDLNQ